MPVNLYYTQHVRGFQQESVKYSRLKVEITLRRTVQRCPKCGAPKVTEELQGIREPLRRFLTKIRPPSRSKSRAIERFST